MPRTVNWPPQEPAGPDGSKTAGWWHASDDGATLVCDLCPRGCHIAPGKRGFCFVRQNVDGRLVCVTYGRSTGFCIDPIEKKPLSHFYPGTSVLSFGTAGCNLGCKFCQNWTSSRSRQVDAHCDLADPEAIAAAASEHGCRSVAFTYNDPIVFAEYAIDTAHACHARGIKTVAVTNGYVSAAARGPFFEVMDAANVDLKAFTEEFYHRLTGGHLQPVLDTLRWLVHQSDVWLEVTNLIVPRENDSPEELRRMCDWIAEQLGPEVPVHFSAFHPDFEMTDRPPTPPSTLALAYDTARQAGLHYVYTGNVSDRRRQSTYCPNCDELLIERDGYQLGVYAVEQGKCARCATPIAGRFDDRPGEWGNRRLPVRIARFASSKPSHSVSKGENTMEAERPKPSQPNQMAPGRPELSSEQEALVFQAAGRRVASAVQSLPGERLDVALSGVGNQPLLGAFVSLKRGGQLRSCCGYMGNSIPLHVAVDQAAFRAAREDPRFPPISPTELGHLDMEVWLLWGLEKVTARGRDRAGAITIGRHGLQIMRGPARGLLLPGVAVDHDLDPEGFLEAVCRKAGLPTDAWLDDDTTLMTFEGYAIHGRLDPGSASEAGAVPVGGPSQADVAALAAFCRQNLLALAYGATPSMYAPMAFDGQVCGAVLITHLPGEERIECSRVSLRPDMPLQAGLFELVNVAARALQARRVPPQILDAATVGLSVLWDSAIHGTVGEPELAGIDPGRRAVMVVDRGKWAVAYDPERSPEELLSEAVHGARLPSPAKAGACSLEVVSSEPRFAASNVRAPQSGPEIRRPAAASSAYPASGFYPADPAQLDAVLDELLPKRERRQTWPGAMVPHAGWQYSGRLAAQVFGRLKIPERVIIVAPRHRPVGAEWAVAPHGSWSLPGRDLASDPELAQQLAEAVTGLELDAAAHAQEHAIEVQLPFFARLAPESKVVGIVVAIQSADLDELRRFADEMAGVLRELPDPPLLVISTDMNHYASDAETRRVDRMALDCIESLDPAGLYRTVTENRISMCGMLPAVLVMETLGRLDALNRCESVGYATSADASGETSRVVGYAGMLFA
jgi:AmmeMemoRadiSam system radical SAM enzyme/AmmeMemoRadiSam system protein B/AmmeMemoRadiSam system protein A